MSTGQANYGQSSHGLRGDYSRMRPDYTVDQDYVLQPRSRTAGGGSTGARSSSSTGAPATST